MTLDWVRQAHAGQQYDPPFDLRSACEEFGIRLLDRDLPLCLDAFRFRTSAGTPHIVLNKSVHISPQRKRFTLAHEIGHVRLHLLLDAGIVRIGDSVTDRKLEEAICNHFAGALLMPPGLFRSLWREYRHKPYGRLAIIANRFDVSIAAVKARALHLELAEHGQYHAVDW